MQTNFCKSDLKKPTYLNKVSDLVSDIVFFQLLLSETHASS